MEYEGGISYKKGESPLLAATLPVQTQTTKQGSLLKHIPSI